MKKLFVTLLFLLGFSTLSLAETKTYVYDNAGLLNEDEIKELNSTAGGMSSLYKNDIVILTVSDASGKSPTDYADDFYDYNGYSDNGVLFYIDMGERDIWISTAGDSILYFTDSRISYILDYVAPNLTNGDYYNALKLFLSLADETYKRYVWTEEKVNIDEYIYNMEFDQKDKYKEIAERLFEEYGVPVIMVYNNKDEHIEDYIIRFFANNDFGDTGIVLGINDSMVIIRAFGDAQNYIRDEEVSKAREFITKNDDTGDVAKYYYHFMELFLIKEADALGILGRVKFSGIYLLSNFIISIIVSTFALVFTIIKTKAKKKTKYISYTNESQINFTQKSDTLIDTKLIKRYVPPPSTTHNNTSSSTRSGGFGGGSTTHTSSSGRTHGGGGRKF